MSKLIVLGGGCFWCTEAVMQEVDGILSVQPGYAGGDEATASYDQVSRGVTKHVEVVEVLYDTDKASLEDILRPFFVTHDPTSYNRQGADVGPQYASVIFYSDEADKLAIQKYVSDMEKEYDIKIITRIEKLDTFYPAESDHHNFYRNNPYNMYCQAVINPKMAKFRTSKSS